MCLIRNCYKDLIPFLLEEGGVNEIEHEEWRGGDDITMGGE